jgi:HNH endonuclease
MSLMNRHTDALESWDLLEDPRGIGMCDDADCEVPLGHCHCGCGELAPIAKKTTMRYRHIRGGPVRYINGHYQRSMRLSSVDYLVDEESGCWVWQRHITASGYGGMRDGRRMRVAHRVYYERRYGKIPDGKVLDHLCANRACVNPDHLEPVTHRENTLRGETIAARRAAQTECVHGHPFTPENTIVGARGRNCRRCQRSAVRKATRHRYAELSRDPVLAALRRTRRSDGSSSPEYVVDRASGCWVWQGYLTVYGYGSKTHRGKSVKAHRFYYELYNGPIPEGLMLDHLCRNRACVNPSHLEPVTAKENARRRYATHREGIVS